MKKQLITSIFLLTVLVNFANAQTETKNKFLDTLRVGIRYQVQEFHTLNQKLLDNCNCDEGLRLKERALQAISASFYEPVTNHFSVGGDLGGAFGTVMDDNRNYNKYTFFQMRAESFLNFFSVDTKLRPYLSGGVQLVANASEALVSLPVGAGLRYQLIKGGYVHIQTAYDRGFSSKLAKNMITNVGFHVPLYKRKEYKENASSALYTAKNDATAKAAKPASAAAASSTNSVIAPPTAPVSQLIPAKPELLRIVYFDSDTYSLNKSETVKVLTEVEAFAKKYPEIPVYLTGHTDSILDDEYNIALSKKRVDAVLEWLKRKGISEKRINISYKGKTNPATSNNNEAGRAGNRRVEILIK